MAELNWKRGRTDAGIRVDDELVAADLVAVLPHPRRREGEQHGRTAAAPQSESEPWTWSGEPPSAGRGR